MNYDLSFVDELERVQDLWHANFDAEYAANCWMWVAGGVWVQHSDWSAMELWCRKCCAARFPCPRTPSASGTCCIARVPASALKQPSEPEGRHRARPIVLIVERDAFTAIFHESMIAAAGCSVASFPDHGSAEKWLSANSPDAAIIEVRPRDKACAELARKLAVREIPFLAVSSYPADSPGVDRVFRSFPWFEKPITPASLQLALRGIL